MADEKRRRNGKMTIREFAGLANTSTATVSRAFSNKPGVSEKERKRILQLAARTGYSPNKIAQNLALQKSHVIGLVAGDLENPSYVRFFRAVQKILESRGYQILIADSERSAEKEHQNVLVMQQHQAEGLIIFPVHDWNNRTSLDHLIDLRRRNFPFVVIGKIEGYGFDCVSAEEVETAGALTRHLLELGHRRFAFVGSEPHNRCVIERLAGVRRALEIARHPLSENNVIPCEPGWTEHMVEMLQRPDRPTAIVFVNHMLAMIAWPRILRAGLNVPGDLSLVAFGDSEWARSNLPALTTTVESMDQVASQSLELLMQRIRTPGGPTVQSFIQQRLMLRQTAGPAPSEIQEPVAAG